MNLSNVVLGHQFVKSLVQQKNLRFENESRVLQALAGVQQGVDWLDAMLWAATPAKHTLATFDKKFANKASELGWQPLVRNRTSA